MLYEVLKVAKTVGRSEVYLVCREANEASRKTIIKNGGILQRTFAIDAITRDEYIIRL